MSEKNWQRSSFCGAGGNNCVEVAAGDGGIVIRESTDPGVVVVTTPEKLRAFILGVKAGEFDHFAGPAEPSGPA